MKKEYIKPTTAIVQCHCHNVLMGISDRLISVSEDEIDYELEGL